MTNIRPHDPPVPRMLPDRVDALHAQLFQPRDERVEIALLKVQLKLVPAEGYGLSVQKAPPRLRCLQAQSAGERLVCAEVRDDAQAQNVPVKRH